MIIKQNKDFQLLRVCCGRNLKEVRYYIECKFEGKPRGKRISKKDADSLQNLSSSEFTGACVLDFGVGFYQK